MAHLSAIREPPPIALSRRCDGTAAAAAAIPNPDCRRDRLKDRPAMDKQQQVTTKCVMQSRLTFSNLLNMH